MARHRFFSLLPFSSMFKQRKKWIIIIHNGTSVKMKEQPITKRKMKNSPPRVKVMMSRCSLLLLLLLLLFIFSLLIYILYFIPFQFQFLFFLSRCVSVSGSLSPVNLKTRKKKDQNLTLSCNLCCSQ